LAIQAVLQKDLRYRGFKDNGVATSAKGLSRSAQR